MSFFVGYCIVCLSSLVIALSVLLRWLLHCLSFFVGYCIVCPSSLVIALSVLLRFTASDYPFGIFKRFLNRKKKQFKETNTKSWLPIITNFKIQTSQASGLTVVSRKTMQQPMKKDKQSNKQRRTEKTITKEEGQTIQ
jgi:hypothetical protein